MNKEQREALYILINEKINFSKNSDINTFNQLKIAVAEFENLFIKEDEESEIEAKLSVTIGEGLSIYLLPDTPD